MAEYEYKAKRSDGQPATGNVRADTIVEALAKLAAQGVVAEAKDLTLLPGEAGPESPTQLSTRETVELVEAVADLAGSELPLSAGLRAAAEEIPRRRIAAAMRRTAEGLDRGKPLHEALEAGGKIPPHLRGLILAGLRTGRVAHVLEELVALDRDRLELRRRIIAALVYPMFLLIVMCFCFLIAQVYIARPFVAIFNDFGLDLPAATRMLLALMAWTEASGLWTLAILLLVVLPASVVFLAAPKPAAVQRACYRLPILGPLWRWQSLVDFSRLMQLFLERQVPMAQALRWTADGLRWSDLAEVSRACAGEVEAGESFTSCLARYEEFPASIRPVIESGLAAQDPAQGFAAAADMYRRRAGVDATLWEAILPPLILLIVAASLGFLVVAVMLPMAKLVSLLS